jgi:hypothetical protein
MASERERQDFLFDLKGYRVIIGAVEPDDIRAAPQGSRSWRSTSV